MSKTPETAEQGAFNFTKQVWKEPLGEVENVHIKNLNFRIIHRVKSISTCIQD
jgi:hypothetical protein